MRLVILYGSQTGTAQDVAEHIWRATRQYKIRGPVMAIDDYPLEKLVREKFVIFVLSTTGQGEMPDNMRQTWRFLLRRNLPEDLLDVMNYACLGLGDSGYVQFNYAAKKFNKRLMQLSATPLIPMGLCDDQHDHGLSAVALPWIDSLFKALCSQWLLQKAENYQPHTIFKYHVAEIKTTAPVVEASTSFAASVAAANAVPDSHSYPSHLLQWPAKETPIRLTVLENKRTTAEQHFQDVRLLRFNFPDNITWQPGDVLQLRPSNSQDKVDAFFKLMAEHRLPFHRHTLLEFKVAHAEMPLLTAYLQPVTLEQLVAHVWDMNAMPRQRAFELLAINCSDQLEGEKLRELQSAEGLADFIGYVQRPRRNLLEVLQDFRHATSKLSLQVLCELFAHMQARSYSIASAASTSTLDLLVAVVNYKTALLAPRLGLCTNWLKGHKLGDHVWGRIKAGNFDLPTDLSVPLIMVGPGTGIAPFRSIVQHRLNMKATPHMVVFFGCRNREMDYHMMQNFNDWKEHDFVEIYVAFSRDQDHKVYVQHLIEMQKKTLKHMIREDNAVILVAGASKNMPNAVKEAFIEVLDGDISAIDELFKVKRYQQDTWS